MRPRNLVRPAAAGALCFAFTCAGAQTALAQSDTSQSTPTAARRAGAAHRRAQRKLDVRAGKRTAVRGTVAPGVTGSPCRCRSSAARRWKPIDRDRTDAAGRYKLRERLRRTGSARCASASPAARASPPASA